MGIDGRMDRLVIDALTGTSGMHDASLGRDLLWRPALEDRMIVNGLEQQRFGAGLRSRTQRDRRLR